MTVGEGVIEGVKEDVAEGKTDLVTDELSVLVAVSEFVAVLEDDSPKETDDVGVCDDDGVTELVAEELEVKLLLRVFEEVMEGVSESDDVSVRLMVLLLDPVLEEVLVCV